LAVGGVGRFERVDELKEAGLALSELADAMAELDIGL
jgi:hypothetical protein